jgi:hypothetical protein
MNGFLHPELARLEAQRIADREAAEKAKIDAGAPSRAALASSRKQELAEHANDRAWASSEHAKTIAELEQLDLMRGEEAGELGEAVEILFAALARFNAAAAEKVATAQALDGRARELGGHLRAKHGVSVVGRGAPNDHEDSAKALWTRASAALRDLTIAAGTEHGTMRAAWLIEGLTVGTGRANHSAYVARTRAEDARRAQAAQARAPFTHPAPRSGHPDPEPGETWTEQQARLRKGALPRSAG